MSDQIQPKPLVSIVTNFFNAEKYFEEAIESVFAQTYNNWELLLVDDGSTDGSTAIALRYAQQYPEKVRYLEHEGHVNRGRCAARNLGIEKARGEYIAFLDADDVYLLHKLEQQLALMDAHPEAAIVFGPTQYWHSWTEKPEDTKRDSIREVWLAPNQLFQPPKRLALLLQSKVTTPATCSVLIQRQLFDEIGGFEGFEQDLYEDQAFFAKVYLDDMTSPCEGIPHGVPTSYDWASNPRVGMGNNPQGFQAMTAWGQVYEPTTGNSATNTRVQIRNIRAYMLSKQDNQWHLLQASIMVEGAAYREDYVGDVNRPADIRYEPDGSISVKVGQGYNFHFWPPSRAPIDPDDVGGIFTTVQARLIIDNPQQADDTMQARYLLSMGGDYWLNLTASWDNWKTNGDIAIGKFKYVTTDWQAFNMTTLSPDRILQNPPPIE